MEVVEHEDRLTEPQIRGDGGELHAATWDEAYDRVVSGMERIRDEYGPDAMGVFGCSKATNEENYLLRKLARRYGTNNVDNCTRMCHASTVYALRRGLGAGR
jgi:predicted molibdopterin-dependent oxidoreductase YjgC